MWTRYKLKENGKRNFKRVYSSAVIVCLIVTLLGWITGGGHNSSSGSSNYSTVEEEYLEDDNGLYTDIKDEIIDNTFLGDLNSLYNTSGYNNGIDSFVAIGSTLFIIIFLVIFIFLILLNILIVNPIKVGKNNFFMGIRESDRKVKDILFVFNDKNWIKTSTTLFFSDLFVFLWSLLLVIPGIVKSYEYRMIPYILAENTNINRERAFELSRMMMQNQKFKTFILDLSFIGWEILSSISFGILGILYVNPYVEATNAELYAVLREDALRSGIASSDELPGFSKTIN